MYKFRDVPKGKRLKYFKDYYGVPTIIGIICLLMVISIVRIVFFTEKDDMQILVASAASDVGKDHLKIIEKGIIDNYNIDFTGNGKEKLMVNEVHFMAVGNGNFIDADQDTAAVLKLTAVLETSDSTIQIVDEHMYNYLLGEQLIETYENLEKYGLKGEGYIKVPLSETKLDPKNEDKLYLTVRPEQTSRIDPEVYEKHIKLVKEIIG